MMVQMEEFADATYLLRPGAYLLRRRGKVVFVGKALNLPDRIAQHRRARESFDQIQIVSVDESLLDATVEALIAYYAPPRNLPRPAVDLFAACPPPQATPASRPLNIIVRL
jgi:hypothetical protein